jgi:hypothetical protein
MTDRKAKHRHLTRAGLKHVKAWVAEEDAEKVDALEKAAQPKYDEAMKKFKEKEK